MNSGNKKSIFLADDDLDNCTPFQDALKEVCAGATLTTASDGEELIDILTETVHFLLI